MECGDAAQAGAGAGAAAGPTGRPGQRASDAAACGSSPQQQQQHPAASLPMAGAVAAAALVAGALLEPAMRFAPRLLLALVRLVLGLAMRACLWVAGAAAAAALLYLAYKLAVMVHAVFTYKDESLAIQHDCYTPDDYDHRPDVQQATIDLMQLRHPDLVDMAKDGTLVAFQPGPLMQQHMQERMAQLGLMPLGAAAQNGDAAASSAAAAALAADAMPWATNQDVERCLMAPPPPCIIILGTSHVSQKSAGDVEKAILDVMPGVVMVELCPSRAPMLFADEAEGSGAAEEEAAPEAEEAGFSRSEAQPEAGEGDGASQQPSQAAEGDAAPQPPAEAAGGSDDQQRSQQAQAGPSGRPAAAAAAQADGSTFGLLQQALNSKDHNMLQAMLQLMYARIGATLKVRPGGEFVAARRAVEALQLGAQDGRIPGAPEQLSIVLGDRPAQDTLRAMWSALTPRKRLSFIFSMVRALLFEKFDEDLIEKMKDDDFISLLCREFGEEYPELMGPLLHDRNWYLAIRMWLHAQHCPRRPLVAVVGKGHVRGVVYVLRFLTRTAAFYQAWLLRQQLMSVRDGEGQLASWSSLEGVGSVDEAALLDSLQAMQ